MVAQIEVVVEPPLAFATSSDPGVVVIDAQRGTAGRVISHLGPGDVVVTADARLVRGLRGRGVATMAPHRLLELLMAAG